MAEVKYLSATEHFVPIVKYVSLFSEVALQEAVKEILVNCPGNYTAHAVGLGVLLLFVTEKDKTAWLLSYS